MNEAIVQGTFSTITQLSLGTPSAGAPLRRLPKI
jgi:hypothetical protein